MKRTLSLISMPALCIGLLAGSAWSAAETDFPKLVITAPFSKVYKSLNPDSGVITIARAGTVYDLDHEGKKWYRVWVNEETIGFIAKADAKREGRISSSMITITLWLSVILLLGVLVMVRLFAGARKKKRDALDNPLETDETIQ